MPEKTGLVDSIFRVQELADYIVPFAIRVVCDLGLAELLRSDHPLSLRGAYPLLAANFEAWARFDYTVRTGKPAFDHVHGRRYYDYLADAPYDSERFDDIQTAGTRAPAPTDQPTWAVRPWITTSRITWIAYVSGLARAMTSIQVGIACSGTNAFESRTSGRVTKPARAKNMLWPGSA